jgi:dTDP-4-dehydrorhamnose reductase
MRIAILGSAGQLGRDLCALLTGDVVALTRAQADLTKPELLDRTLKEIGAEVVVNCAAYNFVDRAEIEPEAAFATNAWGVRHLALVCQRLDAALVHFSTDYVFGLDAARNAPYSETDSPGPQSAYALSKLVGEYWVRSFCSKHFVIRTCGLYGVWGSGGKGSNFVETMLRIAGAGKPLKVVSDQLCTPSSTRDVAAGTSALLQSQDYGLYHLTNAGAVSWYEFALAIFDSAGMQANVTPITSVQYAGAAARPRYSVLDCTKFKDRAGFQLQPWRDALSAYLQERTSRAARTP